MLGVVEVISDYLSVKIIFDVDNLNERTTKLANIFNKDSVWYVKRLCNLVTLNREFQGTNQIIL
jgi:hypothetical protein